MEKTETVWINLETLEAIVKEVILTVPNRLFGFLEMRLLYQYIVALIKHGISPIRELNLKKSGQVFLAFHWMPPGLPQQLPSERRKRANLFWVAFQLLLFLIIPECNSFPTFPLLITRLQISQRSRDVREREESEDYC